MSRLYLYRYDWKGRPGEHIRYHRTSLNETAGVYFVEFFATDGEKVWRRGVYMDAATEEVLQIESYHVLTSALRTAQLLDTPLGEQWENEDYEGSFTATKFTHPERVALCQKTTQPPATGGHFICACMAQRTPRLDNT